MKKSSILFSGKRLNNLTIKKYFRYPHFSYVFFSLFIFIFLYAVSIFLLPGGLYADNFPDITAEAAIIANYKTGDILWQKNADEKLFPASTTKMMTAIIALERIKDLGEIIKIPEEASGSNNSFFAFKTGDEISLLDLIKAALINSHNNATIALAIYISGSEQEFIKLMNEKAREIGALNTNFQNTNGLDSNFAEHKSTARDLYIIAKYCMANELFSRIVNTREENIIINGKEVYLFNTNILLFFDYIKGIKTGFTNNAGYCEVLYSCREGLELISVVLKSAEGKRESDMLKMINWANDNYKNKTILDKSEAYSRIIIKGKMENNEFEYKTMIHAEVFPEKNYEKLVNINDKIEIAGKPVLKVIDFNKVSSRTAAETVKMISRGDEAGKVDVKINNRKQDNIFLVYGENIDKPNAEVDLAVKSDNRLRNTLIFIISFYFFIFILIIFRNLIQRTKE